MIAEIYEKLFEPHDKNVVKDRRGWKVGDRVNCDMTLRFPEDCGTITSIVWNEKSQDWDYMVDMENSDEIVRYVDEDLREPY